MCTTNKHIKRWISIWEMLSRYLQHHQTRPRVLRSQTATAGNRDALSYACTPNSGSDRSYMRVPVVNWYRDLQHPYQWWRLCTPRRPTSPPQLPVNRLDVRLGLDQRPTTEARRPHKGVWNRKEIAGYVASQAKWRGHYRGRTVAEIRSQCAVDGMLANQTYPLQKYEHVIIMPNILTYKHSCKVSHPAHANMDILK